MTTQNTKFYGATYDAEGVITSVFEVDGDWDGYRFHGYCRVTVEEANAYFAGEVVTA